MHKKFIDQKMTYDGSQLTPLYNYLNYGLLGDSAVAWMGPCNVEIDHMIDGEDLREQAQIAGDEMLHVVLELFDQSLHAGVFLQRLMAEMVKQLIYETGDREKAATIIRKGDDLYWHQGKLNVSIATSSNQSVLIHFGINVTNQGTPVETSALADFMIKSPQEFAGNLLERLTTEVTSQKQATWKVRTF